MLWVLHPPCLDRQEERVRLDVQETAGKEQRTKGQPLMLEGERETDSLAQWMECGGQRKSARTRQETEGQMPMLERRRTPDRRTRWRSGKWSQVGSVAMPLESEEGQHVAEGRQSLVDGLRAG